MRPPRPKHHHRGADSGRAETGHSDGRHLHGVTPKLRCAVYTRKSSEEGLEMEFNSLDAQREACEAYIASQRGEGWVLVADRYDDGGVSGGTLDRPALRRLLADVQAGRIDIVVVYKVDRLSRSLLDFHKLIELFERHQTTFVSITQSFNTTDAMGRMHLNIMLTFAQYEREVTRKGGRLYRYYISQSVMKRGTSACPIRQVPAAEIERIVIDQIRSLLQTPEVIVQTWRAARKTSKDLAESDVRAALLEFEPLWNELFPAEQARIVELLVERVDLQPDGIDLRLRVEGLTSLCSELRGAGAHQEAA